MKKTMIMSLLAIMVIAWACDKGGGSEEVAPAEVPKGDEVVKDTIKKDSLPSILETPCEKDSTLILSTRVDIGMGIIKELAPKDKTLAYSSPIPLKPFYIIINNAENEIYKKLVTQEEKLLPATDFEKYSLVVAGIIASSGDGVKAVQVTRICTSGTLQSNIFMIYGASAAFTPINFSFTIPKVKDDTKINFNIIY